MGIICRARSEAEGVTLYVALQVYELKAGQP